jgi:hypothetical protein
VFRLCHSDVTYAEAFKVIEKAGDPLNWCRSHPSRRFGSSFWLGECAPRISASVYHFSIRFSFLTAISASVSLKIPTSCDQMDNSLGSMDFNTAHHFVELKSVSLLKSSLQTVFMGARRLSKLLLRLISEVYITSPS